jgi:hypothetical protein
MVAKPLVTETSFLVKKPMFRGNKYKEERRKGLRWKRKKGVYSSESQRA